MVIAALHAHSRWSDGEFTVAELRDLYLRAGVQVLLMTDHAEALDAESLRAYIEECRSLSDDQFTVIAGLEFECERRLHVLGFGVTELVSSREPERVIARIEELGGVSVIAHPPDALFPWIESFERLPRGIEGWNTKYDGRYAPRASTFGFIQRLRSRDPELLAFYGQDLHWRTQHRGLLTWIRADGTDRAAVLAALRAGAFEGVRGDERFPSDGKLSDETLARYALTQARSARVRYWIKRVRTLVGPVGRRIPAELKNQIRRVF